MKRQIAQNACICLHACKRTVALHASPLPHLKPAQQLAPASSHSRPREQWTRNNPGRTTALNRFYYTPCLAVFGPTELHGHRRCPAAQQWRIRELLVQTQIALVCGDCRVAASGAPTMDKPSSRETSIQHPAGRMGQDPKTELEMQCIIFVSLYLISALHFAAFACNQARTRFKPVATDHAATKCD